MEAAERSRTDVLALTAALVTVTAWGSAFVGIRAAGEALSPGALALGRLVVSSLVLGAIALVRRKPLPARRDLVGIAIFGLLWLGVYSVALNEAERRVDAGTAAMLVATGPIVIALLAGLLLGEGFPAGLLVGCAVAFAGVAVIGVATSRLSVAAGWGVGLCLVAAVAYAAAVVAQKPVLARVSPFQLTWLACVVATVACLPFAPALARELPDAEASAIAWTAYLGIVPTAIGFATWSYAETVDCRAHGRDEVPDPADRDRSRLARSRRDSTVAGRRRRCALPRRGSRRSAQLALGC